MPVKFIPPISSCHRPAKVLLTLITIIVIALNYFGDDGAGAACGLHADNFTA